MSLHRLVLILLVLAAAAAAAIHAAADDEVLILVKRGAPPAEAIAAADSSDDAEPRNLAEAYARWYKMASIVVLDSPSGPKPGLGLDNVYDAHGYPVPRMPDPFTLRMMMDPSNEEAITDYLDWRRAAIRRASLVANSLPDQAMRLGMVTPETIAYAQPRPTDQQAVGDLSKVESSTLGTPMMAEGAARAHGMEAKDIPVLPGQPSASGIEVYWFWHHRCPFCAKMARNWFAFARTVNASGHKAVSIDMSPIETKPQIEAASTEISSLIELWQITWGADVEQSRNWLDWTSAGKALGITGTPTTVFINRRSLRIERLVGPQEEGNLRHALAVVGGWNPDQWPPPRIGGDATGSSASAPPGATPVAGVTPLATWTR